MGYIIFRSVQFNYKFIADSQLCSLLLLVNYVAWERWNGRGIVVCFSIPPPSLPLAVVLQDEDMEIRQRTQGSNWVNHHISIGAGSLHDSGLVLFRHRLVVSINVGRNEYVFGILLNSLCILFINNKVSPLLGGYISHWSYTFTSVSWWGLILLEIVAN